MERSSATERIVPLPFHSSASAEHYTPIEFIEAARETMGGIDLDPASTRRVNELRIKAKAFFGTDYDGLAHEWHGSVWLNPPGGRVGNKSSAAVWWGKLADEYTLGRVTQAIFMGFSIELLATSQAAPIWPGDVPFCIPRRRIELLRETTPGVFEPGESPTHSNIIVYLPPRKGWENAAHGFGMHFRSFGKCRI